MSKLKQINDIDGSGQLKINNITLRAAGKCRNIFVDALLSDDEVVELHYAGDRLSMVNCGPSVIGLTAFVTKLRFDDALVFLTTCYATTLAGSINRWVELTLLANTSVNTYGVATDASGEQLHVNTVLDALDVDQWLRARLRVDLLDVDVPTLFHKLSAASWFPGTVDPLAVVVDQDGRRLAVYPLTNVAHELHVHENINFALALDDVAVNIGQIPADLRRFAFQLARDQMFDNAYGYTERDDHGVKTVVNARYRYEFTDALVRSIGMSTTYYTLVNDTWCALSEQFTDDLELIEAINQRVSTLRALTI